MIGESGVYLIRDGRHEAGYATIISQGQMAAMCEYTLSKN